MPKSFFIGNKTHSSTPIIMNKIKDSRIIELPKIADPRGGAASGTYTIAHGNARSLTR